MHKTHLSCTTADSMCVCVCVMACLSQSALALRPKDSNLAVLAANAYVAAHDYNRAIDHYNR